LIRMNRGQLARGAAATAGMLLLSMALPLIAFAQAYIFQATYDKSTGTVTASVYTDETVTGNVYLNIMDDRENVIGSVYLPSPTGNYTVGNAVYDRYDFTYSVTKDVYDRLRLTSSYADPDGAGMITSEPYVVTASTPPPANNGGGGGGGYVPPGPTTPPAGTLTAGKDGSISADRLAAALAKDKKATVQLEGTYVLLPAKALVGAAKGSMVLIAKDGITLALPLAVLDFDALADRIDTDVDKLMIRVDIAPLAGDALEEATDAVKDAGAQLRSGVVEFKLAAIGDAGRTAAIDDFDGTYVERTLPLSGAASPSLLSGVLLEGDSLRFVPTALVYDDEGKATAAVLKRPGNSTYAVVERTKTFADIAGHWGRADIERMAGHFIIEGVSSTQFEPDRSITRAEFSALLVRSLGLNAADAASERFNDVQAGDWFAEAVATASGAGLVRGYPDGAFRPNDTITRAEMATMIVRAIGYATGTTPQMTMLPSQIRAALAPYADGDDLDWAKTSIAIAVHKGIIQGMTETTIAPNGNATRAQAAVMLKRWLTNIDFIP